MNREWSELNRTMQLQLKKRETFGAAIDTLLQLRSSLMEQMLLFRELCSEEDFCAMPFPNAQGYHSKTIAYSLWHIFRIEDITAHSLIAGDQQVLFAGDWQKRIGSPLITTGNELVGEQIVDFSRQLQLDELYRYMAAVDSSTAQVLQSLSFEDTRVKMTEEKKRQLQALEVVSEDESARWLIDYWCSKDVRGLIQMPLSRHWIMHVEACLRIGSRLQPGAPA